MCFSVQADLTAGVILLPVAALSLREVRHAREVPFAALPLLFALHQLVEALVWAGVNGDVSSGVQHVATLVYLIYAFPVLPTLVPTAVLLLEPHGSRLRVAPFVALGLVVSAYLAYVVLADPVRVVEHSHALEYSTGIQHGAVWAALYVAAVIGPSVLSGYRSILAFGVLNLVGLAVVAVLYVQLFASVWCVYAALSSLLVLLHMYRRRHLPEAERRHGLAVVLTPR